VTRQEFSDLLQAYGQACINAGAGLPGHRGGDTGPKQCSLCAGLREENVLADPSRCSEQGAIRTAIRHADALFERLTEAAREMRERLQPAPPAQEVAHG
jgi:hypothetical protein